MLSSLHLKPLDNSLLTNAVALDLKVLGGLWSLQGYQQELNRSSSCLLGLLSANSPNGDHRTASFLQLLGMGCLWGILDEAHITVLAVDPQFRRQGVGHTVLYGLLAIAHQRQLTRATLEVRASNHTALALYEKFGFRTAGRRPHYYADHEDALILWRGQLQTPAFATALQNWHQDSQTRLLAAGWSALTVSL